jgi:hypothetical protein
MIRTLLLALALTSTACGPTIRQTASISIVGAGAALATVHERHQRAYVQASQEIIEQLRSAHGSLIDYDRQIRPVQAAFVARSEALVSLDSALYAAASILDATRDGSSHAYAIAAQRVVQSIQGVLRILADGSVMPPIVIPPEVDHVITALLALSEQIQ